MVNRGIASLALVMMVCFLLLSHFDPQFFWVHLYESLIYIVMVVMLLYAKHRWPYMLGIVAPAGWLLLSWVTSGFGEVLGEMSRFVNAEAPGYTVIFLGNLISILSVSMMALCCYSLGRGIAGVGKRWSTFLVCLGVVAIYYGALVIWIWRLAPSGA